jgi:hypothetical protein
MPERFPPTTASSTRIDRNILGLALPGILLAIACLIPFLNKAYTIDDPPFLLEARQILKTPLHPWSFPICWMGETCVAQAGDLGAGAREGLMGYLLVPVILTGGVEWLAHLLQIVWCCVVVIEMVKLALRLGFPRVQAAFCGAFIVAIPPFLVMANTAMPDILALALGLTGIERLLAWKIDRRWHQAAISGLALGLAPYARPHLALFLPLGALLLFDGVKIREAVSQFRRQSALWTPILISVVVLTAVNIFFGQRNAGVGPRNVEFGLNFGLNYILFNLFAYLHYLSFPIPFTAVWLIANWRRARVLLVPLAILLVISYVMLFPSMTLLRELQLAAVLYGFVALADMIYVCLRADDGVGILLSLWVLMPLPAVIYVHLPVKYMVATFPAISLIIIRTLTSVSWNRRLLAYGTIILICTFYSIVLLRADADFADYGRRAASELIVPYVAKGEKVWYGGEWGFYWYAQQGGARVSKPGEPGPNPGELLAVGLMEGGDATLKRFPNREFIDSRSYDSPHGRTMGYGAGLYSNHYGYLPWRWNPGATNVYQLWRIH